MILVRGNESGPPARHRGAMSSRVRVTLLTGAVLGLLVAAVPSAASAASWFDGLTEAQRETLVNFHFVIAGNQVTPYQVYDAPARAMADELDAETDVGTTAYQNIAQSATLSLEDTGMISPAFLLRANGAYAPVIAGIALATAGVIAYSVKLGNQLMQLRRPGPQPDGYSQINFFHQGYNVYFGGLLDQDSWLFKGVIQGQEYFPARWFEAPCDFSGVAPPALSNVTVHMVIAEDTTAFCSYPQSAPPNERFTAPIKLDYPWIDPRDLYRLFQIRRYNPGVDPLPDFTIAPVSPNVGGVESKLNDYLDQGGSTDTYKQWLEFELRVPGARNPLHPDEFNMPDCSNLQWDACRDLLDTYGLTTYRDDYYFYDETDDVPEATVRGQNWTPGTLVDAGHPMLRPAIHIAVRTDLDEEKQACDTPYAASRSQPPLLQTAAEGNPLEYTEVPPSAQFTPPTVGVGRNPWPTKQGDAVSLNYGVTTSQATGWGWYKIKMKHGWNPDAVTRTSSALSSPDSEEVFQPTSGNWMYVRLNDEYSVTTSDGKSHDCAQVVVVDRRAPSGQPKSRGIVTSFGGELWGYILPKVV